MIQPATIEEIHEARIVAEHNDAIEVEDDAPKRVAADGSIEVQAWISLAS